MSSTLSNSSSCSFPAASFSTSLRPRRWGFAFGGTSSTSSTSMTGEQTATDMASAATMLQNCRFLQKRQIKGCFWCSSIHSRKVDGVSLRWTWEKNVAQDKLEKSPSASFKFINGRNFGHTLQSYYAFLFLWSISTLNRKIYLVHLSALWLPIPEIMRPQGRFGQPRVGHIKRLQRLFVEGPPTHQNRRSSISSHCILNWSSEYLKERKKITFPSFRPCLYQPTL